MALEANARNLEPKATGKGRRKLYLATGHSGRARDRSLGPRRWWRWYKVRCIPQKSNSTYLTYRQPFDLDALPLFPSVFPSRRMVSHQGRHAILYQARTGIFTRKCALPTEIESLG